MAASNSTPIQLYYSNTPGGVPTSTSLIIGELAINVPDGIIFYKDASNNVNVIARTSAAAGQFANVTFGDGSIQYKSAAPWAYTNSIHGIANTAIADIIYIQGVDVTQNAVIANTQSYANGAFLRANAGYGFANTIYSNYAYPAYAATLDLAGVNSTQNTNIDLAFGRANAAYNTSNTATTNITALQGVNVTQNTSIQSAIDTASAGFGKANTNASDIVALQGVNLTQNTTTQKSWDRANAAFDYANNIIATGGSVDAQAREYANGAFTQANTNTSSITYIQGVNTVQNTSITNVGVYANGAFSKANNAVANTNNITLASNLTVPGQANVYNRLAVGTGAYQVLPNLIAQFTGTSGTYSQINQQNLSANGTGDVVITADNGTDSSNYADMGMAGSTYDNTTLNAFPFVNPNDGYFMIVGDIGQNFGGNVFIGTTGSGSYGDIVFVQGNDYDQIARFKQGSNVEFYRPMVANSFTTKDGVNIVTYTDTANTYLKGLIDTKVSKSGDTINGTLTINNSASANALVVTGNVIISQDLRVSGNLFFGGNSTTISSNNLTLQDSLIYVANSNPTNVVDIGIVGSFTSDKYQHTGLVRDHTDGKWKLFSNVSAEPTTTIDFANAVFDTVKVGGIESDTATIYGINVVPYINVAFTTANSAWTTANNKVSSVSGTSGRITSSGSANVTLDLATTGVTGGSYSYPLLQVDSYGRVTTISTQTPVTSFNTRTGAISLGSSDVTSALGYTPVDTITYSNDLLTQAGLDAGQNTRIVNVGSYANGAFVRANAAAVYANGAFLLANSTNELVLASFDETNASFLMANTAYGLANTNASQIAGAFNKANNSGIFANGAFVQANTTNTLATNAYDKANAVGVFANSAFDMANTAYSTGGILVGTYANAAFVQANSAFDKANSAYSVGGLLVGTYANAAFITANSAFNEANSVGVYANGAFTRSNSAYDMANTAYNTGGILVGTYANAAFVTANSAFDKANVTNVLADSGFLRANIAFDTANTNATNITNVGVYANGAFTRANNVGVYANGAFSLANTTFELSNAAFGVANSAQALAGTAAIYANGAFTLGNTTNTLATNAGIFANGSFIRANASFDQTNNVYGWANTIYSNYAYPAYANTLDLANVNLLQNTNISLVGSYANSSYATANAGYLQANNASIYANGAYSLANTTATTLTLEQTYTNAVYTLANTNATAITTLQGVDTTQNTSITSAFGRANAAFDTANSEVIGTGAFLRANTGYDLANTNAAAITSLQGVDTWQNTYSQQVHTTANGAFTKANDAYVLANSAYAYANTLVSSGTSIDGWARGQANAAFDTANASYSSANTSLSLAQSSFNKANSIVSPTYYTGTTPPVNPSTSAIWYNTATDVMYEWITSDGTNYFWIDIDSPTVTVGNTTISYTYTGYGRAAAMAIVFGGF